MFIIIIVADGHAEQQGNNLLLGFTGLKDRQIVQCLQKHLLHFLLVKNYSAKGHIQVA